MSTHSALPVFLTLLALGACLPGAAIRRAEPGFGGASSCRLEGNQLGSSGLRLDVVRSDSVGRDSLYQLTLHQLGATELRLRSGVPLRLSLGEDSLVLEPVDSAPARRVVESEFVLTGWRFPITAAELQQISTAEAGTLVVPSVFGEMRIALSTGAKAQVARFLTECSRAVSDAQSAGSVLTGVSDPWVPVNEQDFTSTPSGLRYDDEVAGTGAIAKTGDRVSVHYTGWLEDGTRFDSSRERQQPFQFVLGAGSVIRGWDEGVQGMRVGGRRRLLIPPELGYGAREVGGVIPANSTLVFEVELLSID